MMQLSIYSFTYVVATAYVSAETFGTVLSSAQITDQEQELFNYTLPAGSKWGYTTHFWITGGKSIDNAIIRYYVDGEPLEFSPPFAAGVGWDDQTIFMHKWAGKGSDLSAWNVNFRVPFTRNFRVTYRLPSGSSPDTVYMIVRGMTDQPLEIGGVKVPLPQGKMILQAKNATLQPMDFLSIVDIPQGMDGFVFQTTLQFEAPNLNTLEGCFHLYQGGDTTWPGTLLASGTEDYYDSSYYFALGNATWRTPVSGLTHLDRTEGAAKFSAYRYHEMDPLVFSNGARMDWRNGDMDDPVTGHKCFMQSGGKIHGHPGVAKAKSYGWVYVWPTGSGNQV